MAKRRPKTWLRLAIWRPLLHEAQLGWCPLCAKQLNVWGGSNIDHVIPVSRGGPSHIGNLMLTHAKCNQARGNTMPSDTHLRKLAVVNAKLGLPDDPMVSREIAKRWSDRVNEKVEI